MIVVVDTSLYHRGSLALSTSWSKLRRAGPERHLSELHTLRVTEWPGSCFLGHYMRTTTAVLHHDCDCNPKLDQGRLQAAQQQLEKLRGSSLHNFRFVWHSGNLTLQVRWRRGGKWGSCKGRLGHRRFYASLMTWTHSCRHTGRHVDVPRLSALR